MKKALKIICIIFAGIVMCLVIFYMVVLRDHSITKDDGVKTGYFLHTNPQGTLEKIYTNTGAFAVATQAYKSDNKNIHTYTIYYPKKITTNTEKFPAIIMVNGTDTPTSEYQPILEHLASWGFIVIGNEDHQSGSGESTSMTLDFLLSLNTDKASVFYNKIDTKHIGINGHSQGGAGAINAVTQYNNGKMYTSLYTASSIPNTLAKLSKKPYDTSKITIPYFMIAGLGIQDRTIISPLSSLTENYNNIHSGALTVMARRKDADHKDVLEYADAYMTAWFLYTLKDDPQAKKVFVGKDAELIHNTGNRQDVSVK